MCAINRQNYAPRHNGIPSLNICPDSRLQFGLICNAALSAFFGNFIERICASVLFFSTSCLLQVNWNSHCRYHIVVFLVNSWFQISKIRYFYALRNLDQVLFLLMTIANITLTAACILKKPNEQRSSHVLKIIFHFCTVCLYKVKFYICMWNHYGRFIEIRKHILFC